MRASIHLLFTVTMVAATATAQVRLPAVQVPALPLQALPQALGQVQSQSLDRLSDLRHLEIGRLIRANRRLIESDPNGEPVIRSEILVLSPSNVALQGARSRGFIVDREQNIGGMNIRLVVLRVPPELSTKKALQVLREADPDGSYDYNHIYSGSGVNSPGFMLRAGSASHEAAASAGDGNAQTSAKTGVRVGLLDTGIDTTHPVFSESAVHTWGCGDHVVPAAHGTAVASLMIGQSAIFHGVQPDAALYAADVYCGRPTGGAADALIAALGWLVQERIPVINVSLVGPNNAALEAAVRSLIRSGYVIVAAVGNDGPAAPALYPASYPGVVGVTGIDAHRQVLIEAARGPQVMFAAPGADVAAASMDHGYAAVRGTSFAAPFVAALLAGEIAAPNSQDAASAIETLAKTAVDIGQPGRDLTYGFGLVGADYRIDPVQLIHR
ncbi:MAG: S8 family serine peptidase [Gammaproteobacteria bacterium]